MAKEGFTVFRRRGSDVWYFYAMENGRRVAHSTKTEDKALAEERARKYLEPLPIGAQTTVGDWAADFFVPGKCRWLAAQDAAGKGASEGAALGRRSHLTKWILPAFGKRTLSSITPGELRDWIIRLPLSSQSKRHMKYTLNAIFSEAVLAGLIDHNPVRDVPLVKLKARGRDALTYEDLHALFPLKPEELIALWGDAEMAAFMLILAATGIRSGEARALRWRHIGCQAVTLPEGSTEVLYLQVEDAVKFTSAAPVIGSTKAGKPRPVFLPARARAALEWWKKVSPWPREPADFIFPGRERDRPLDEDLPRQRFKKAIRTAEVDAAGRWLTPHSFRHAYVSRTKRALPADTLMLMVGHADEKTNMGYFHESLEQKVAQIAQVRALIEGAAKW
jgi:integrase